MSGKHTGTYVNTDSKHEGANMTSRSTFLPRLSLSRSESPGIPFHNPISPTIRKKPSEHDMDDLSPRPDDSLLPSEGSRHRRQISPSLDHSTSDRASSVGSASKSKPNAPVLFHGPPPPIATSRILYRDEEEPQSYRPFDTAASTARNVGGVLFDRQDGSSAHTRGRDVVNYNEYEPDAVWRNLHHRERQLQKELQNILDVQSACLLAQVGRAGSTGSPQASDAGTTTPTSTSHASTNSMSTARRVSFAQTTTTHTGHVIPVRQPKKKRPSIREARTGLARHMTLLADLKVEEDANLTAALSTRRRALAQLRKLCRQREEITGELEKIEQDEEEPLAQEIRELTEERSNVASEIKELEERLVGLRNRKRYLDAKVADVESKRDAGLSGYRGALKDVNGKLGGILTRPSIKPLDLEGVIGPGQPVDRGSHLSGLEFLRLRPERRTPEMAKEWWEGEVALLTARKADVHRERLALEEGVGVWRETLQLVDKFELSVAVVMKHWAGKHDNDEANREWVKAMSDVLGDMKGVIADMEGKLRLVEENGWNLLICAIGAELEALELAKGLLVKGLRAGGLEVQDGSDDERDVDGNGGPTPHLGRSMPGSSGLQRSAIRFKSSSSSPSESAEGKNLVGVHDVEDGHRTEESDNEVPPDLLVSSSTAGARDGLDRTCSRESTLSENEVPPEFLAEHV
ncbi:hypothetical protein QC761_503940 [Podospora bellae-mahoneyi]|uniref:Autophagy-related protein 28 n=1 Tax=Podospora bellae-mahoneyi TaxID=2093777 RepID=A0ABR0FFC6_9PEZI|nr:hypothetical protein QC761_503940 [Podospora bellae-mahoneyi]